MSDFRGVYRNALGAEIEIVGLHRPSMGFLGTFYQGVQHDSIFGDQSIVVEPAALAECGYVKQAPLEEALKGPCECGHDLDVHFQDGCVDKSGGGYFCQCVEFEPAPEAASNV
jgi:hypothetical protein